MSMIIHYQHLNSFHNIFFSVIVVVNVHWLGIILLYYGYVVRYETARHIMYRYGMKLRTGSILV